MRLAWGQVTRPSCLCVSGAHHCRSGEPGFRWLERVKWVSGRFCVSLPTKPGALAQTLKVAECEQVILESDGLGLGLPLFGA